MIMQTTDPTELRLPLWAELPQFSLHLDQLLDITNMVLAPITEDQVTKTMMHNYFKAEIIMAPVKKRYTQGHLAGAIVVGLLKNVFALTELKQAMGWLLADAPAQEAYDNFVKLFNEQAAQQGQLATPKPVSVDLTTASPATVMQYEAVQAVLHWLAAKRVLRAHEK